MAAADGSEGLFLLSRDLLDQQVIDVHGRKVVRVNDVDFNHDSAQNRSVLKVGGVDVGARGAVRRLLKGMFPQLHLELYWCHAAARDSVGFRGSHRNRPCATREIEDFARKPGKLHPADIADIIESLAPDEREAVFETLDEGVAAGALEELEPRVQKSVLESLEPDRAADIVEEMEPDAAADLLGDLSDERTEEILVQMQPEERQEVTDLLEFRENTLPGA